MNYTLRHLFSRGIIGFSLIALSSFASADGSYGDSARVIKVVPVYRDIKISTPYTDCNDSWNTHRHSHSQRSHSQNKRSNNHNTANVITGGVIGGVVGHQIGHGKGRVISTLAGTAIGAIVAGEHSKHNYRPGRHQRPQHQHPSHQCQTTEQYRYKKQLDGYDVSYIYKGEMFRTHMQHHPGKRVRVNVQVSAIGR